MNTDRFSLRYGFSSQVQAIRIRNDAPAEVREGILAIAQGELRLQPSYLRSALCTVLRCAPNQSNWSEYPNIWDECQDLMASAPWYRVYDFVEYLYDQLIIRSWDEELTERWSKFVNELFLEKGVGWRLQEGQLERLGGNGFQEAVDGARAALCGDKHRTAHAEISEALKDLSRRPDPDLTGAVQHAMAALECTAREVTRDPRPTLGDIVKRHERLFPCPLDEVVTKLWGYSSEFGRHLREGRTAERPEVELVVAVAAALCSYLASKTDA